MKNVLEEPKVTSLGLDRSRTWTFLLARFKLADERQSIQKTRQQLITYSIDTRSAANWEVSVIGWKSQRKAETNTGVKVMVVQWLTSWPKEGRTGVRVPIRKGVDIHHFEVRRCLDIQRELRWRLGGLPLPFGRCSRNVPVADVRILTLVKDRKRREWREGKTLNNLCN